MEQIKAAEWITIFAIVVGPILALQIQKWLELGQAKRARKDGVFRTLMATRAARVSSDHVQALNMIPIAFYGSRIAGRQRQTAGELAVCSAFREYLDNLNTRMEGLSESQRDVIFSQREAKFTALLGEIAKAQSFDFEPIDIRGMVYFPIHHSTIDADQEAIRTGLAHLLTGQTAINMNVVNLPNRAVE
jgi:hypothetical protein